MTVSRKTPYTPYEMVTEFHKVFGGAIDEPITAELMELRHTLIYEEYREVVEEFKYGSSDDILYDPVEVDKAKLTKELADLMYVIIGTGVTFGLPLEKAFREVHRSNMSKLGADGKPILREDGKVLKSDQYEAANIAQFF